MVYNYSPLDSLYLRILKTAVQESGLQLAWALSESPSFGTLTGLGITSTMGTHQDLDNHKGPRINQKLGQICMKRFIYTSSSPL